MHQFYLISTKSTLNRYNSVIGINANYNNQSYIYIIKR